MRRAFSLVELLTVISIIAVLAALIFPVLSRAKLSSRKAVCIHNLHHVGVMAALYLDTFSAYPPFGPDQNYHREGFWDYLLLASSGVKDSSVSNACTTFLCPATPPVTTNGASYDVAWPEANWTWQDGWNRIFPNLSYAYNGCGTGFVDDNPFLGLGNQWSYVQGAPPLRQANVVAPAVMVYCADYDVFRSDDDHDGDLWPMIPWISISARHNGGGIALFCDAHVECRKTNRWTIRREWNADNQDH